MLPDKHCLSRSMCLYQVLMTLHILNDVTNDAESTQLVDLKVLRRSPDLLNNVEIGQGQLQLTMKHTGQHCYVKLAYLEYTAYVEVIIHSRLFPLYCFVFQTCLCRTWLS